MDVIIVNTFQQLLIVKQHVGRTALSSGCLPSVKFQQTSRNLLRRATGGGGAFHKLEWIYLKHSLLQSEIEITAKETGQPSPRQRRRLFYDIFLRAVRLTLRRVVDLQVIPVGHVCQAI